MRRVCILGVGGSDLEKRQLAEVRNGNMEIWAVNEAYRGLPEGLKSTREFQIHVRNWREPDRAFLHSNGKRLPPFMNRNCFGRNTAYVEYLRTCGVPVYTQEQWPDIPTAIVYPFEKIEDAVGIPLPPNGYKRLWATSSFGYMAALLLTEHLEGDRVGEVLLLGVELPLGTQREKLWEWPNLAYYLGLMTGLGIKISLPSCGSSLLSAPHYAWGGHPMPQAADHWFAPGYAGVVEDSSTLHLGTRPIL